MFVVQMVDESCACLVPVSTFLKAMIKLLMIIALQSIVTDPVPTTLSCYWIATLTILVLPLRQLDGGSRIGMHFYMVIKLVYRAL